MNDIKKIQEEIIEDFALFDDWTDKYEYIIEEGKNLPSMPEEKKTDKNIINGCQSKVWIDAHLTEDNKMKLEADSDAIITKGLTALLIRVLNNQTPEDILNADLFFIEKIGLSQNLSPTRSNGFSSMIKQIQMYALAYKSKLEK